MCVLVCACVCEREREVKVHEGPTLLSGQGDYWCVKTPDVSGNNVMIVRVHVQTFACVHICGAQTCTCAGARCGVSWDLR